MDRLSDVFDRASAVEELERAAQIEAAKAATGPKLKPMGACHYCWEPVEGAQIFCNSDCATKHAQRRSVR